MPGASCRATWSKSEVRQKEIRYSSRTRSATDQFRRGQKLRRAFARVYQDLPEELRALPEAQLLAAEADDKVYNIIQLIYRSQRYEGVAKDYEFSRRTMEEHWQAGYHDAVRTLRHPEVLRAARRAWTACSPSIWPCRAASERLASRRRPHERERGPQSAPSRCRSPARPSRWAPTGSSNREFLIITYRTDPEKLRALVPEPLEIAEPIVKFEFIRMPDSTGFGDYTESGQVIPVSFQGRQGGYTHCMFLDDHPPIAGGRELWGFPKKLAKPTLRAEIDTLVGTLDYGPVRVATGTMGYKHKAAGPRRRRGVAGHARPGCSRSSRTSTARRASASWSSTISRTSPLKGAWSGPGGA